MVRVSLLLEKGTVFRLSPDDIRPRVVPTLSEDMLAKTPVFLGFLPLDADQLTLGEGSP